jgi:hypothetical protein
MNVLRKYLAAHRWQRRLLTISLSLTTGMIVALLLYPHLQDYWMIRALGSEDPVAREVAIGDAVIVAAATPRFVESLEDALDTDDDLKFEAIARVLNRLGKFYTPRRDPVHVSRMQALQIEATQSSSDPHDAWARRLILSDVLRAGRDDRYVRRALATAVGDGAGGVREMAAVLAGQLGEDEKLATLLADEDPAVQAAAALAAGIAGRSGLVEPLREMLSADDVAVVSSAAWALAVLSPKADGPKIAEVLAAASDAKLRARLLHVMTILTGDVAEDAVRAALTAARKAGKPPEAMALLAAGKLGLASAAADIRAVLATATTEGSPLIESQLLAALTAADAMGLPVRREAHDICRKLWNPMLELTMMAAADLLGRQTDTPQPGQADPPPREDCVQTLREAAVYVAETTTRPDNVLPRYLTTPMASATAARSLWRLKGAPAGQYVRNVCADRSTLPGDHIAWHLGRGGEARAFDLGMEMLPAVDAPLEVRVYNDNERSAGAMLLALSARTDKQKQAARQRITSRLVGGPRGGEDDPYVRGAYRCALGILGEDQLDEIRQLMNLGEFPQRRGLTALLMAGDLRTLDGLFFSPRLHDESIVFLLVNKGIADVLAAALPQLPTVDVAAEQDLRIWQVRILRDTYGIRRKALSPPPKP